MDLFAPAEWCNSKVQLPSTMADFHHGVFPAIKIFRTKTSILHPLLRSFQLESGTDYSMFKLGRAHIVVFSLLEQAWQVYGQGCIVNPTISMNWFLSPTHQAAMSSNLQRIEQSTAYELSLYDFLGYLPIDYARLHGHIQIVATIERKLAAASDWSSIIPHYNPDFLQAEMEAVTKIFDDLTSPKCVDVDSDLFHRLQTLLICADDFFQAERCQESLKIYELLFHIFSNSAEISPQTVPMLQARLDAIPN